MRDRDRPALVLLDEHDGAGQTSRPNHHLGGATKPTAPPPSSIAPANPSPRSTDISQGYYWLILGSQNQRNPHAKRIYESVQDCIKRKSDILDLGDFTGLNIDFSRLPTHVKLLTVMGNPSNLDFSSARNLEGLSYTSKNKDLTPAAPQLKLPENLVMLELDGLQKGQLQEYPTTLLTLNIQNGELDDLQLPNSLTKLWVADSSVKLEGQQLKKLHFLSLENTASTEIPQQLLGQLRTLELLDEHPSIELLKQSIKHLPAGATLVLKRPTSARAQAAITKEHQLHHADASNSPLQIRLRSPNNDESKGDLADEFTDWISLLEPGFQLNKAQEENLGKLSEEQTNALRRTLQELGGGEQSDRWGEEYQLADYKAAPFETTLRIGRACKQLLEHPEALKRYADQAIDSQEDCVDRRALDLLSIELVIHETQALLAAQTPEVPVQHRFHGLLQAAQGAHRQHLLMDMAHRHATSLKKAAYIPKAIDITEIVLKYFIHLSDELELPTRLTHMKSESVAASVSDKNIAKMKAIILNRSDTESHHFKQFLANWQPFQEALQHLAPKLARDTQGKINHIEKNSVDVLMELDKIKGMNEQTKLEQSGEIMKERLEAIDETWLASLNVLIKEHGPLDAPTL